MNSFKHLLSPLTIRGKTYKNRVLCGPTGYGHFLLSPRAAATYRMLEERAAGGQASVCVGETSINNGDAKRAGESFDLTTLEGPHFQIIQKAADLIHQHGAIAMMELFHPGSAGDPNDEVPFPWGPVDFVREDGVRIIAYDEAMMEKTRADFASAAFYMKKAGYDGILIHGGHGWLFSQFLSPLENSRTDAYGGPSLADRARFPLEILRRIREQVGEDFIIELRISGSDRVAGGTTAEHSAEFSKMLSGLVDILHVSSGHYYKSYRTLEFSSLYSEHGCNAEMAAIIKKSAPADVRVGVIGGINSPEMGEQLIADGIVDFIILGRQLFADPNFTKKIIEGHADDIQRCLRCNRCYNGSIEHTVEIEYDKKHPFQRTMLAPDRAYCSINPEAGGLMGVVEKFDLPAGSRQVLVIGGGAAGLAAAVYAFDRGHQVTLVEKSDRLGGVLWITDHEIHKADLKNFRDVLIRRVEKRGIKVLLNTEATADFVATARADVVIVAVGGSAVIPPIPGIENAIPALEVYKNPGLASQDVVIVGGGLVGCDTAIHLAELGRRVTVIEMLERVAIEAHHMAFTAVMDKMDQLGVVCLAQTHCTSIEKNGVQIETADGEKKFIPADSVVVSLGMRPNADIVNELASKLPAGVIVKVIGDCSKVERVGDALKAGYLAAMRIS